MNDIKKARIFGKIVYILSVLIRMTMKIKIIKDDDFVLKKRYIYGFWHNIIFLPMVNMTKNGEQIANLVSPSKDGEIIAEALHLYGYKLIRGSSNKDSVKSLVEMIRNIKNGMSGGFAVDGPKGPPMQSKQGIIYSAQKTGVEIVPLAGAFSKKWVFEKTWDKTEFPKPFSKAVYIIGKPFTVPADADVDEYCKILDKKLNELTLQAQKEI